MGRWWLWLLKGSTAASGRNMVATRLTVRRGCTEFNEVEIRCSISATWWSDWWLRKMVTGSGDGVWGSRWLGDGISGGSRGCAAEIWGDVTCKATIPIEMEVEAHFLAKVDGIVAGIALAEMALNEVDPSLKHFPPRKNFLSYRRYTLFRLRFKTVRLSLERRVR
ncbi:hypothetical protein CASFOL_014141 [Castilleja foliolosa]|uniref:Uncharacterized protein n=1 Tax=Castilleja foliolosa TaxID=1961234 RepID=A0ABD3DM13_9LAMI